MPKRKFKTSTNTSEWEEYSKDLNAIIEDRKSGVLLDPKDHFHVKGGAFELGSGYLLKKFLTLWELFDDTESFDRCMEMFAKKAQSIYAATPFSVMLTCTETGKYIMEYTHGVLDVGGPEISLRYLGNFPFLGPDNPEALDLRGKKVLIVTDVIASATLVQRLADVVEQGGGAPVAALCLVMVSPMNHGSHIRNVNGLPFVAFGRRGSKLPIHSLTRYPLQAPDNRKALKKEQILRIDPTTVFPADRERLVEPHEALFDRAETFAHLEEADAIEFGFFQVDQRRFTTAIRFPNLLAKKGDGIWEKIEEHFARKKNDKKRPVVATTFTREDVRFRKFVESHLAGRKARVRFEFIAKRDSLESHKSYFLLPWTADELENRPVILLLASVHTAERLTHLAALLASYGVRRITAICLINGMGSDTAAFVSRIQRLLSGLETKRGHANFTFVSVYDVADLASEDIAKAATSFEAFLHGFEQTTVIPSFERWVRRARDYIKPRSVTTRSFDLGSAKKLSEPFVFSFNGATMRAVTVQGKLSLLCSHVVAKRDYAPIVEELETVTDPDTAYALLGLLFADVSYLKMTGNFDRVRGILVTRLEQAREIRFRLEDNWLGTIESEATLRRIIEGELDLLFGLAMLSYVDERYNYEDLIVGALDCGKALTEWHWFPANAIYYFGNDRVMWTIAMLLYASRGQERFRERLRRRVSEFIALCDRGFPEGPAVLPVGSASAVQQRLRVKTNFSVLQAELRSRRKEKHELIRFLHSHLLAPPQRHSPINSALTDVGIALEQQLGRGHTLGRSAFVKLDFESKEGRLLKVLLDEAIYTTGLLQDIAASASELFFVTPTTRSELARYTASSAEPGFAHDVVQLGDSLQRIRVDARVSRLELQEIVELKRVIFEDLWGKFSRLRKEITRYVVPLPGAIEDAVRWANQMLKRIGFANVWTFEPRNLNASKKARDIVASTDGRNWNVLVDPQLLKQVLRNIHYNARHNFRGYTLPDGKSWGDLVSLSIEAKRRLAVPHGSLDYVVIRAESLGTPPSTDALDKAVENSTFAQHRLQIKEFGGSLSLNPGKNAEGTVVELVLLSRANVQIK